MSESKDDKMLEEISEIFKQVGLDKIKIVDGDHSIRDFPTNGGCCGGGSIDDSIGGCCGGRRSTKSVLQMMDDIESR